MLQDWTIQARTDCCDVTGQPFADGEFFYTLLYRDRHDALSRRDVSAEGWKQLKADKTVPRPFSFWRSKFTPPPPREPDALPKADAETRLRRFLAENRPEYTRAAYILALMLERKRVLRPTDSRQDENSGRRLLFYEHAATGETFVVTDPGLKLDQLEEVPREVSDLLKNADAEPAPAPESAAT